MSTAAPGWYADAENPAIIRWWDGETWTDHTQPNPTVAAAPSAPVPPPASGSVLDLPSPVGATTSPSQPSTSFPLSEPVRLVPPSRSETEPFTSPWASDTPVLSATPPPSMALATTQTTPNDSEPMRWTATPTFAQPTNSLDLASVDYEPLGRTWDASRNGASRFTVTGVSTGGAWMLALVPLVQLGLLALGWVLTDGGSSSSTVTIGSGLGGVLVLWVLIATIADFRRLGTLGHEYRPSFFWILVGPLMYLIARAIHVYRTTGSGVAPTWVYIVLSVVVGSALAAGSLLLPREASLTELRAVESTIVSNLQQQGLNYSVLCPDQAELAAGSTFVCTAYDEIGPVALLRVSYGGVPGSFTYEVESSRSQS